MLETQERPFGAKHRVRDCLHLKIAFAERGLVLVLKMLTSYGAPNQSNFRFACDQGGLIWKNIGQALRTCGHVLQRHFDLQFNGAVASLEVIVMCEGKMRPQCVNKLVRRLDDHFATRLIPVTCCG